MHGVQGAVYNTPMHCMLYRWSGMNISCVQFKLATGIENLLYQSWLTTVIVTAYLHLRIFLYLLTYLNHHFQVTAILHINVVYPVPVCFLSLLVPELENLWG